MHNSRRGSFLQQRFKVIATFSPKKGGEHISPSRRQQSNVTYGCCQCVCIFTLYEVIKDEAESTRECVVCELKADIFCGCSSRYICAIVRIAFKNTHNTQENNGFNFLITRSVFML